MFITEKQAQSKGCCSSRTVGGTCIASRCMAWRWHCWVNDEGNVYFHQANGSEICEKLGQKPSDERIGYCGLAGSP